MRVRRLVGVLGVVLLGALASVGVRPVAAGADSARFRFSSDVFDAGEGQGFVRVSVERVDLPVSRTSVDYRTRPGTATDGSDFDGGRGTLVFDVGATSATFVVVLRDDEVPEAPEELGLVLEQGSAVEGVATVRIFDDDSPSWSAPSSSSSSSSGATGDGTSSPSARGISTSSAGTSSGAVAAAPVVAPAPTRAASRRVPSGAAPRRRVTVRQSPVTPFELRPAPPTAPLGEEVPGAVDPILAVGAALLVGRVAAEVWFRLRAGWA